MTPERLAELDQQNSATGLSPDEGDELIEALETEREELCWASVDLKVTLNALAERNHVIVDLTEDLKVERARLDTLANLRPGELFDALSDPRGLRAALDDRIVAREREKGAAR